MKHKASSGNGGNRGTGCMQRKISKVIREGYAGKLHAGGKTGPLVTSRAQMAAIAYSEARHMCSRRRRANRK